MAFGILGIIFMVVAYVLSNWWDDKSIDRSPGVLTGSAGEREVNRATDKRRNEKRQKLEAQVRKLNEENPDKLFYRDGPYIKEYTHEEVAAIRECERLNAPFAPGYPQYYVEHGRVEYADRKVKRWKFEARMREINRDFDNGICCDFDPMNMKLTNRSTGEEIPFDPDDYELPEFYFRGA